MNILFYLLPKSEVIYVYDDDTLRQAVEKMEYHKYSAVPIITRTGTYVGTLTEGDILWEIKRKRSADYRELEATRVRSLNRKRDNQPVNINCEIEDLIMTAMNQNFIPVIDDNGTFIGIVTRKSIIEYCYAHFQKDCDEA
ncbi:MAG: CBS domain-containing protein [Lachnospiraceae bacterium]|nr:CBS domain-containing protein [Lachnospiraceae bacterium]MCD7766968.1 CBS domain-containing protein [Lachnospiraceae bacterium]